MPPSNLQCNAQTSVGFEPMSHKLNVKATKVNMVELDPMTKLDQLDNPSGIKPFGSCVDNCENAVVKNVNANPRGFDASKPCPVCQQTGHTFDDCPVLENISHLQTHCIRWKMCLADKHRKESEELMQQTQINQFEVEHMAIEHEEVSGKEEVINFSDAATKPISHVSHFQPGQQQKNPMVQPPTTRMLSLHQQLTLSALHLSFATASHMRLCQLMLSTCTPCTPAH